METIKCDFNTKFNNVICMKSSEIVYFRSYSMSYLDQSHFFSRVCV